jgi:hypothetical protein
MGAKVGEAKLKMKSGRGASPFNHGWMYTWDSRWVGSAMKRLYQGEWELGFQFEFE